MKIELDGTPLSDTQVDAMGGIMKARSASNINVVDERNLAMHDVPGMQGSVFQDLGRTAVKITFDGLIMGANAKNIMEQIRSKFKGGKPVPFLSDLSGTSDVSQVVIDSFTVNDTAGTKDRYDYSIALKEYREQPGAPATPAATGGEEAKEEGEEVTGEEAAEAGGGEKKETEADEEAVGWADEEANKSDMGFNTVTGKVLDAEGTPVKGVNVTIKSSDGEHSAETDEQGVYRLENLPVGEYTALVGEEGHEEYADVEKKLSIGEGQSGKEGES
jgi:hypothetical protein